MAQASDKAVITEQSQQADRQVAGDGHGLRPMLRVDPTGVLGEVLVADPMQPILDIDLGPDYHRGEQLFCLTVGVWRDNLSWIKCRTNKVEVSYPAAILIGEYIKLVAE